MPDLLPDVRAQLARAAETGARRDRRRRLLPVATVAAVALIAGALAVGLPSERVDIVARAQAALTAPGEIVHTVVSETTATDAEPGAEHSYTTEQWAAGDPTRWRARTYGITGMPDRQPQTETVYADGTYSIYHRDGRLLSRQTLDAQVRQLVPGLGPIGSDPLGADPVAGVKRLITDGHLRDAGDATVEGRVVRRLQGEMELPGRVSTEPDEAVLELTYDVDPESYEPVAARFQVRGAAMVTTLRFERFERLPMTPENEKLLDAQPIRAAP